MSLRKTESSDILKTEEKRKRMFKHIANVLLAADGMVSKHPRVKYVLDNYKYFVPLHRLPRYDNREVAQKYIQQVMDEVKTLNNVHPGELKETADLIMETDYRVNKMQSRNKLIYDEDGNVTHDWDVTISYTCGILFKGALYTTIAAYQFPMVFEIIHPIFVPIGIFIRLVTVVDDDELDGLRAHLKSMRDHRKAAYDAEEVKKVKDALIDKMRS